MKKVIAILTILIMTMITVNAESLFTLGASQNYVGVPRSLFGGVQAHQIGDLISIVMTENISISDNLSYASEKSSTTKDSFTETLKNVFGLGFLKSTDGYGGSNEVSNSATGSRAMKLTDKIAVQVVQQLPNGNLSVQGKKTVVNGNERMINYMISIIIEAVNEKN